jgi:hypothetical protein
MQCGWRLNRFSFDLLKSQSSGTMLTRTVVTHYRRRIIHWANRMAGHPLGIEAGQIRRGHALACLDSGLFV